MNLQNWLEYQQNTHHKTIDLGLERISKVYSKLFPRGVDFKVITIAGTNGKGSTGNFLANIFEGAKINYGWFSSPHIEKYNERFVINGAQATDSEIITAFEKIEKTRDDISLSYFEYSTLAAILIFQAQKIEVAILEIGLGGRLDSVNVVQNDVSIITSIALDHTDFLGDTIEKIAFEKAGIIKENTKTFTAPNLPKVISEIAKKQNTKLVVVEKYQKSLKIPGSWQQYNANLAKHSANYLFKIDENVIDKALKNTEFQARAEVVKFKDKNIIFDTAHNPQAVKNLATIIPDNCVAVFAGLGDKDISAMIESISHKIDIWYLLELQDKRALSLSDLQAKFNNQNTKKVINTDNLLKELLDEKNENIVIFGSFLTISMMKKIIC
jgi:dihydrofolate synthase/folylpolyglutamate synthase